MSMDFDMGPPQVDVLINQPTGERSQVTPTNALSAFQKTVLTLAAICTLGANSVKAAGHDPVDLSSTFFNSGPTAAAVE